MRYTLSGDQYRSLGALYKTYHGTTTTFPIELVKFKHWIKAEYNLEYELGELDGSDEDITWILLHL